MVRPAVVTRTLVCGILAATGMGFCVQAVAAQGRGAEQPIVRVGKRLQVSAATLFSFNREDAYCPIGSFVDATQFAVRFYDAGSTGLKGFGVEVTHVADGQYPWPWPDRVSVPQDHDGGLRVTANAYLSTQRGERLDVDVVLGAGLRRFNEGDGQAEFVIAPRDGIYRIQTQTNPILTYGLLFDFSLTDAISIQGQARANTTFSGDLAVVGDATGPGGESEMVVAGTQTFVHLTAGLGYRVGGR